MPNTSRPNFNPAYSNISGIFLTNDDGSESVDITKSNTECLFERIEMVENINDVFPNGVLIVQDRKDILSRILQFEITKIVVSLFDTPQPDYKFVITSASYLNNASSDTEENFVGIYFSTEIYKTAQNTSLIEDLGYKKPVIEIIDKFVQEISQKSFGSVGGLGTVDKTSNFVLYKPLNAIGTRENLPSDNPIQYLNYLSTYAVDLVNKKPNFLFWTDLQSKINFKYFHRIPADDPSFSTIDSNYGRIGVYDGDDVVRRLSDDKFYRKAYAVLSNPGFQYISKNYYYIKKTPKFLDLKPTGTGADESYAIKALAFQFQDEGEKYNIELVASGGATQGIPGADQLVYDSHWGFYTDLDAVNSENYLNHISNQFGLDAPYAGLPLMGLTGIMPYVDTADMWKNMFDMTEVHPNYPDGSSSTAATNLSKVLDIRYEAFKSKIKGSKDRLQKIRDIELQNFIMYSLCCMGNREDCFFALLQRYEIDNVTPVSGTKANAKKYRYKWSKLVYDPGVTGTTGSTGQGPPIVGAPAGPTGSTGGTYYHQIEKWALDSGLQSSATQDESWAINLNERGITGTYLPPGWVDSCLPDNFYFRPVGAKTANLLPAENIFHIVRLCKHSDGENYVYYFTVENVVDGCCETTGITGSTGGTGGTGGTGSTGPEGGGEEPGGGGPVL